MKRGTVVGLVAGIAVVAAGAGVAIWMFSRPASADDVAEEYLRALADGDASAVDSLLPDTVEGREALLLAFGQASGYLSDYDVVVSDESTGLKSGRAEIELGGESGVVHFGMEQVDGRWMIDADFLGALTVTPTLGDSIRIGDSVYLAGSPVPLLPAVYPVGAAPTGILSGGADVIVTNENPVDITIEASLTAEATSLAQAQLDSYAADCAATTDSVPDACGIRVPWAADLATLDRIAFRVEQLPVVALSTDARTFAATGGVIVATATGTTRAGAASSFTYRADDWALRGTLRLSGDEMTLRVD